MITRTRLGVVGAKVVLAGALVAAPVLGAATATAAPAPASAAVPSAVAPASTTFHAAGQWYWWHCRVQHQWWRPGCHGWGPPPPPPPTGSFY
jgi:hypothetical protein